MRILYLGNNWLGWKVLEYLREEGDELVGLAMHPGEKRKHGAEIMRAASLPEDRILDGTRLTGPALERVRQWKPDIALSILFGYILRPEFLSLFPKGVVNLHPALLPYNRGQYPNVWSIIDRTPAGTSLHYIDEGIDTGDIIGQKEVPVVAEDTGESLYKKLEQASLGLFKEYWPQIRDGAAPRVPQADLNRKATYHKTRDVERVDSIDLDAKYAARELIDVLRARTFPPYKGAFITVDGKRVYLRIQLEPEES